MSPAQDYHLCGNGYRVERVETPNPARPKWYAVKRDEGGRVIKSMRAKSAKHAFVLVERWKYFESADKAQRGGRAT